uniref:Uncharacterized protein n=1 Tax=Panagrolaimus sp. PS1159 TaxID=55785 RepID=A0AC35GXM1_9BILA
MEAFLPQEYKDKLCPSYRQRLQKLEEEFSATEDLKERQQLLESFSEEFIMPRQLWDELIRLYLSNTQHDFDSTENTEKLRQCALYQFYYKKEGKFRDRTRLYLFFDAEHRKLLKREANFKEYSSLGLSYLKIKLSYPHQALDDAFHFYERCSMRAPSTEFMKKYKGLKKAYAEIFAVENEVEKWVESLKEVGDEQFVIHNNEYRLGGNLLEKKLWKLYIEYLRVTDTKEMLHVYSKYCHFFIDDQEMSEKYKHEVAQYGTIKVSWKNPFNFEIFERPITALTNDKDGFVPLGRNPQIPCQLFFNSKNYIRQVFSLSDTVIHYICQSANHFILQKLYQSCKYFFIKESMPICYNFDYTYSPGTQKITYREQSVYIRKDQNGILEFRNLFIANSLAFDYSLEMKYQTFPTIIQSLARCELKHLKIQNQNLTFKEFYFLTGHGNIETLHFKNVKIVDENGDPMPLEDVMAKVPKVYEFCLDNVYCSPETSKSLLQIPFNTKLREFKLLNLNDKLKLRDFFKFLSKTIHPKSTCTFSCDEKAKQYFIVEFQKQHSLLMESFNAKNGKPDISIFSAAEYAAFFGN